MWSEVQAGGNRVVPKLLRPPILTWKLLLYVRVFSPIHPRIYISRVFAIYPPIFPFCLHFLFLFPPLRLFAIEPLLSESNPLCSMSTTEASSHASLHQPSIATRPFFFYFSPRLQHSHIFFRILIIFPPSCCMHCTKGNNLNINPIRRVSCQQSVITIQISSLLFSCGLQPSFLHDSLSHKLILLFVRSCIRQILLYALKLNLGVSSHSRS